MSASGRLLLLLLLLLHLVCHMPLPQRKSR
jgi:hypothetical protein